MKVEDKKSIKAQQHKILAELLGDNFVNTSRFYLISNMSAVVVRDTISKKTTCSLSFYNVNDGLDSEDTSDTNVLIPIGFTKLYNKCLHAAMNYKDRKYTVEFPYIELSEVAVYKTFLSLKKSFKLPFKYNKLSLSNFIHISGSIGI